MSFCLGPFLISLPFLCCTEAQLQSMIDKGRTPLPIFGREDEPTAALTAHALCWIDTDDPEAVKNGFGIGCSFLISFAKIVVTGLSLGTGIIGGHFWGGLAGRVLFALIKSSSLTPRFLPYVYNPGPLFTGNVSSIVLFAHVKP